MAKVQIGDILSETTTGLTLALRRLARPGSEQRRILAAIGLEMSECLSPDRIL